MNTVNELKKVLDSKRPLDPVTTKSLQDDFMLRYNQASNAIEGNQLTLIETRVLLENGITAKGKALSPKERYEQNKRKLLSERKLPSAQERFR